MSAERNGSNGHSPETKRSVGRPSKRTVENADKIVGRLILGESLVSICEDESLPDYSTVIRWIQDDDEFRKTYQRAREMQAHYLEHKGIDLIMSATPETAYLAKVQFDALKWQMARLNPKVYSDKPADINVSTTVHNHMHSQEELLKLQERKRLAMERAV